MDMVRKGRLVSSYQQPFVLRCCSLKLLQGQGFGRMHIFLNRNNQFERLVIFLFSKTVAVRICFHMNFRLNMFLTAYTCETDNYQDYFNNKK